jgi:hypothetical protein
MDLHTSTSGPLSCAKSPENRIRTISIKHLVLWTLKSLMFTLFTSSRPSAEAMYVST